MTADTGRGDFGRGDPGSLPTPIASEADAFLRQAIELAVASAGGEGGPFGALVVKDGRVLGRGTNRVTASHDPTAHAEIVAIREACAALGGFSLAGAEIFSSCEPCPMCLGAILWSRLDALHYAASRQDAARAGFDDQAFHDEIARPPEARRLRTRRRLEAEAQAPFDAWRANAARRPY